jgi:hypothetical protein
VWHFCEVPERARHPILTTAETDSRRRSADFPVRSNFRNFGRFRGFEAASEFEHCCGLESPRSEPVAVLGCAAINPYLKKA